MRNTTRILKGGEFGVTAVPTIRERMNIWFKATWLLIVLLHACAQAQDLPEVQTTHGKIVGYVQEMFGKKIKTFLGIPFAMPPTGNLRFKRPLPVESWIGVLNTTSWHNACYQMPFLSFVGKVGEEGEAIWNPKTPMSEDCLYLNIWVPVNVEIPIKSTMVWIFGGGFVTGTSALELYDGTALAAYADIIVVSINYRLGPLGFLYYGNEEAPGNVGLLDQVLALQWINKNIENFGGVPNDITLFGESAGAASVSYHLMSEMSQPLFQRAIMQSGTCLSHWAHVSPETALTYAKLLAKQMNCSSDDDSDVMHCLQNADAKIMSDIQWQLPITFLTFPIVPTTDNHFIKQSPQEFLRAGRFPDKSLLMGVNSDESVYFLNYYLYDKIGWPSSHFNRSLFLDSIPMVVSDNGLSKVAADRRHRPLVDSILQQYETDYLPGTAKNYMNILDDIGGDFAFKCPVIEFAQEFSRSKRGSPQVFMYSFEHRSETNPWPAWTGVLHGDEIEYVFAVPVNDHRRSSEERQLSIAMVEYWTNFAKYGDPGNGNRATRWPEYTYETQEYIILKPGPVFDIKSGLRYKQCAYWTEFYPKLKKAIDEEYREGCVSGTTSVTSHLEVYLALTCLTFITVLLHR
ncbi:acetylcholinesterase-like [Pecten maximus]|uniref:acetylcholinesterase-like n=1 Tax=Pecten maximus TaxID=6579 RepID=UPI00145861EA|nr:acetylcholinesterase-like [Pecten maximus]